MVINDSLIYTLQSMSRYVMIYIVKNIKVNTLCLDSLWISNTISSMI